MHWLLESELENHQMTKTPCQQDPGAVHTNTGSGASMPGDAAARGADAGQQTEPMLLDALLGLAGFQCCSVSKQAPAATLRSQLDTDPSERGDHSSPGSTKRRVPSKASASSRDKSPPAGPEAGAETMPPPTLPPPTSAAKSKPVAGARATAGVAAECAARRTRRRSTADEGTGRLADAPSQLTIDSGSHAASQSASDPLAAASGAASGDGVAAGAGNGKLDGRGLARNPSSSRTLQQHLKAREQKQDMIFRLEQRLVAITCEYGKVLQKGNDAARWRDKAGLRVVHDAKEELHIEAKRIRRTLHELCGQVGQLQECIDEWPEDTQTRTTIAQPPAPGASQASQEVSTSARKHRTGLGATVQVVQGRVTWEEDEEQDRFQVCSKLTQ